MPNHTSYRVVTEKVLFPILFLVRNLLPWHLSKHRHNVKRDNYGNFIFIVNDSSVARGMLREIWLRYRLISHNYIKVLSFYIFPWLIPKQQGWSTGDENSCRTQSLRSDERELEIFENRIISGRLGYWTNTNFWLQNTYRDTVNFWPKAWRSIGIQFYFFFK